MGVGRRRKNNALSTTELPQAEVKTFRLECMKLREDHEILQLEAITVNGTKHKS